MSNTCENSFVKESEYIGCSKISDIITTENAKKVVFLLKNKNSHLEYNEECTISSIVNIIDKLNPESDGFITNDEKKYLLNFLEESQVKENLEKVLTRYLSPIKDENNFLSQTFFNENGNIDIDSFIMKFKKFINDYKTNSDLNIDLSKFNFTDKTLRKYHSGSFLFGITRKTSSGFEKLTENIYEYIGEDNIFYKVKKNGKVGLLKYDDKENKLNKVLDPIYDDVIINGYSRIIIKKDGKEGLMRADYNTGKLTSILELEYDSIVILDDNNSTIESTIMTNKDGISNYFKCNKDSSLVPVEYKLYKSLLNKIKRFEFEVTIK